MENISEEVLSHWKDIVTKVGEDLSIDHDIISIFKTNKEIQRYIHLSVKYYIPPLEDLIIISALSCRDYIEKRELGKITLIWFCYSIRDELIKKLILLDEKKYSYVQEIDEGNYNELTNITNILNILSSEKNTYKTYKKNKLKYIKKTLTNNNYCFKLN